MSLTYTTEMDRSLRRRGFSCSARECSRWSLEHEANPHARVCRTPRHAGSCTKNLNLDRNRGTGPGAESHRQEATIHTACKLSGDGTGRARETQGSNDSGIDGNVESEHGRTRGDKPRGRSLVGANHKLEEGKPDASQWSAETRPNDEEERGSGEPGAESSWKQ